MEYDGYDEIVRAWIQGVYDSRGNDAKRTLKLCYDIEQYAMKKNDPKLLGFAYYYSAETCLLYTSPSPRDLSTSRMPSSA